MAKTDDDGGRGPRELSAAGLLAMANRIAYFSRRFREISQRTESLNVGDLMVTGLPTAERGEGFLKTFLGNLAAAIEELEMKAAKDVNEFAEEPVDYDAAAKRAESQRKGKTAKKG